MAKSYYLIKRKLLLILIWVGLCLIFAQVAQAVGTIEKLKGRILLQVDLKGEAWYVYPGNLKRYYLGRPTDAFSIMQELGLGISNEDFEAFSGHAPARLNGRILLKVEDRGQAYYVNPADSTMHYLGRPADAFRIMRELGLGINNDDLVEIMPIKLEPINTAVSGQITDQTIAQYEEEASASDLEWLVHEKINKIRQKQGIPPLKWSNALAAIARTHSQDMIERNYLDHKDLKGCEENCRLNNNNYYYEYVIEYLGLEHSYKSLYANGEIAEYATKEEIAEDNVNKWIEYDYLFDPNLAYEGVGIAVSDKNEIYITAKMVMPVVTVIQEAELSGFVMNLIGSQDKPIDKIRTIHDWIIKNIDYDIESYMAGIIPEESRAAWSVWRNKKGVCEGYAELFALMLRYAGIAAEVINGRADAFDGWGDHAWNKIKFVGEDLYIDATWDAGYIENNEYIKNLSDAYYLIPKSCIIVDHAVSGEKEMNALKQKQYVLNNISLFNSRCPDLRDLILYK
jgi:hypothetical protein